KRNLSKGNTRVVLSILILTLIHDAGNILEWGGITDYFDRYLEEPFKIVLSTLWLFFLIISLRDMEIANHNRTKKILNMNIKNLRKMIELTYDFISTTDPERLYRKITQISRDLLELDFTILFLLSEDKEALLVKDSLGFPELKKDSLDTVNENNLCSYVVMNKKPAIVVDYTKENRFQPPEIVKQKGIVSAICAPMILEEKVFGVLVGYTKKTRRFKNYEIALYQAFANEAAIAIKNALHIQELNKEKAHTRALLEAIPDLIFKLSKDGTFLSYKPSQQIQLYVPEEEFLGRNISEVLPADIAKKTIRAIKESLEHKRPSMFNYSLQIEGRLRHFESTIVPFSDNEVVAIVKNVTEWIATQEELKKHKTDLETIVEKRTSELKKRLQEIELLNRGMLNLLEDLQIANKKLRETTKQLEESNRELEAFAYSVSHDLRAPLRAMQGFSEALLEDYSDRLDEMGIEYARRIKEAAERMDNLILDLLTYSRITRTEIRAQPIDLGGIINEVLESLKDYIEEKGAVIEVANNLPKVRATHSIALQIFTNLISNAIKFSKPELPPHIKIYSETQKGNKVRIYVQDNGIGIPQEHHERIFRIFERLHGVETYPGTGIGLAIVKRGAEKVGGSVGLESEPGIGSKFWVDMIRWNKEGAFNEDPGSDYTFG
ncbi:MAG: GAF domain-containing protein, partial [Nitrospirae bacterium]|nr:GAF domain-containing protein [Nitrospirota bacterium]